MDDLPQRKLSDDMTYAARSRNRRIGRTNRLRKAFEANMIRKLDADEATPAELATASSYLAAIGDLELRHQQSVAAMSQEKSPMELMLASVAKQSRRHRLSDGKPPALANG